MNTESLSAEFFYQTARSGGPGGQNVNKVETAVTACWKPAESAFFGPEQKARILDKLAACITASGQLQQRSTEARSQLDNKQRARERLLQRIFKALEEEKPRKATRPRKSAVEARLRQKRRDSDIKSGRRYRGE